MGPRLTSNKKYFIVVGSILTTLFLILPRTPINYYSNSSVNSVNNNVVEASAVEFKEIIVPLEPYFDHKSAENWRNLTQEQINGLSKLGRMLFLDEPAPPIKEPDRNYEILIWKYGKSIENRHLKRFSKNIVDPFEGCSVQNCKITYEDSAAKTADLVIFHLHQLKVNDPLPSVRTPNQLWTFLADESPYHTFLNQNSMKNYNEKFNWSMSYRMDSDVPVPYGRAIRRKVPLNETSLILNKRRDILVTILGSNCGGKNDRWGYIRELQKYIKVDVYGGCGPLKTCPGHFRSNCRDIDAYLFYLSFENSNCDDYVTEKLWWNAYSKYSIPIVMGGMRNTYRTLLPPNSYLNVDDYVHPQDLARHIEYLNRTNEFFKWHQWRNNYEILNEHGYFQSRSYHYCRACEALNYNDKIPPKTYTNLTTFWSVEGNCRKRE